MPSSEVLSANSGQSEKSPKTRSRVRWRWLIAGVCLLAFAILLWLVANFYYANAQTSRSDSFDHPVAFSSDKLNKELRTTNNFKSNEAQTTSKVDLSTASVMMQSEPISVQATPTPADAPKKEKNIFRKILDWFTGLFRKKKPVIARQPANVTGITLNKSKVKLSCPAGERPGEGASCDDDMSVNVSTSAVNPAADSELTYSYTVSGGRVVGQGANVVWDLSGVQPGTYTITAGADNGEGIGLTKRETITVDSCNCQSPPIKCNCPQLSVEGPESVLEGDKITFTAILSNQTSPFDYEWTVSDGTISSGQGTSSITVDSRGTSDTEITAVVEISGPDPCECRTSASQTVRIDKIRAFDLSLPSRSPNPSESPTESPTPEVSPTVTPSPSPFSPKATGGETKPKHDKVEIKYPQRVLGETEHEIDFSMVHTDALIEASNTIIPANAANTAVNVNTVVRTQSFSSIRNKCKDCTVYAQPRLEIIKGLVITSEPVEAERVYDGGLQTWTWKVKTTLEDGEEASFRIRLDFELRSNSEKEAFSDYWKDSPAIPVTVGLPGWIKITAPVSGGAGMLGITGGIIPKKRRRKDEEEDSDEAIVEPASDAGDEVHATTYAPAQAKAGSNFKVQVFAHLLEQTEDIEKAAADKNRSAVRQETTKLDEAIERGSKLTFSLRMPGLETDEPVQTYVWKGEFLEVPFIIFVPKDYPLGESFGKIIVSQDTVPIGRLNFTVEIVSATAETQVAPPVAAGNMSRYQSAFISYASKDRPEVLKRVQMLKAQRTPFFQDMISLNPGDRWEKELYKNIDNCDVVYLFWSEAAKGSKWVTEEILYAHELQTSGKDATPPDIIPIPLEGPPAVAPPEELNFLHFNDEFIYLIYAAEAEKKAGEN